MYKCDIESIVNFFSKTKVLYVEDNQEAREATLGILEEFFGEIYTAVDGEDGFNKYKEYCEDIDLIITDINMPNMNGIEMIDKINKNDFKKVPILVLSAHNEINYFMDSIKVGVNGYLLKPIDIEQFVSLLCQVAHVIELERELKKKSSLLEQYQHIVDLSSIISKTDKRGIITYVNDKFCQISGYSRDELIGNDHNIIRHPDVPSKVFSELWHTIKDEKSIWQGVLKNRVKNGRSCYVSATIGPILDRDGNVQEYIALRNIVTDIMDPKKRLQDFIEHADKAIASYIKIDDFDNLQFFYGAKLSMQIENSLNALIAEILSKETDLNVFALGNGEFVIVKDLKNCDKKNNEIEEFFEDLYKKLSSKQIFVEDIGYDVSLLMSLAYGEDALNDAKYGISEIARDNKLFILANGFSKTAHDKAEQNIKIIKMIKSALLQDRVISLFQPIINNKTKEVEKYESLVRIIDENDQIIPPGNFLEYAKKGMFYSSLTSKILSNSFKALNFISKDISINLSVYDIEKEKTRLEIYDYLEKYKTDANRVIFELLESEEAIKLNVIKDFIKHVKAYGVKIAIDDFGSGYSNLERLTQYDTDIIKLDGSLIKNLETDRKSLSIVKSFLSFAKEQNIQTVGEFVENENIYMILKDLGVDYSQGYYFSKPIKLEEIIQN